MIGVLLRFARLALSSLAASTLLLSALLASPACAATKEVLVVLMQRPLWGTPNFTSCGWLTPTDPAPPRHTATEWQNVLDQQVTPYFITESTNALKWQFKVVANPKPGTNGWWPAQQCTAYPPTAGNFGPGSFVADAAQRLLPLALSQGVITNADINNTHNFIVIDNRESNQGQTTLPQTYQVGLSLPFNVSPSTVGEGTSDTPGVAIIRHELGNQLGLPELFTSPCPFWEPGGTPASDDCYGFWDMASSNFNSFGAYERMLAGWLSSNATQFNQQSWSGTVSISPLEKPNDDKLALILSTDGFPQPGSPPPPSPGPGTWQGYIVECRRQIVDDVLLPGSGVLVTYFNSHRTSPGVGGQPAIVVRTAPQEPVGAAILNPGNRYWNSVLGVKLMYTSDASNGSCIVSVNSAPPTPGNVTSPFNGVSTHAGSGLIDITWDESDNAVSQFQINVTGSQTAGNTTILSTQLQTPGNLRKARLTAQEIDWGTTWVLRVRACWGSACSAWAPSLTVVFPSSSGGGGGSGGGGFPPICGIPGTYRCPPLCGGIGHPCRLPSLQ